MEINQTIILTLSFSCLSIFVIINTSTELLVKAETQLDNKLDGHKHGKNKLFVFGDSYADTGNSKRATAVSWKPPYGVTFPGKPAGRFSDGRVLTDYLASFMGIKSPIPYKWIKYAKQSKLKYGMNFAFGGTGVFNTMEKEPNMSLQINFLEKLIQQNIFTKSDLNTSVALISLAGNDYAAYLANKGIDKDLKNVTTSIVEQLVVNLKRIRSIGVPKIAVTSLEPLGCLPPFTSSSYQNCTKTLNSLSQFHNQLLNQSLQIFDKPSDGTRSIVVVLDLYTAFMAAFRSIRQKNSGNNDSWENYINPMEPCCVGVSNGYSCGSVDVNGTKKYSICKNPEFSVFWDNIHPSQNGWDLVFSALKNSLHKLLA